MASGDMPGRWGAAYREAAAGEQRARIVGDFVAGMTDPFALDEYARLFDERPDFR
jgi:dGTPase